MICVIEVSDSNEERDKWPNFFCVRSDVNHQAWIATAVQLQLSYHVEVATVRANPTVEMIAKWDSMEMT